jgi:ribonuclease VapC
MFVDASAIIAVLAEEPKAAEVLAALQSQGGPFVLSPLTVFEATLGLTRARLGRGRTITDGDIAAVLAAVIKFLEALRAEEADVSPYLARKAVDAAARFGRIVGHPADLNFGDCFAYAHAQARGEALMFVGNDFIHTDVRSALDDPRPMR